MTTYEITDEVTYSVVVQKENNIPVKWWSLPKSCTVKVTTGQVFIYFMDSLIVPTIPSVQVTVPVVANEEALADALAFIATAPSDAPAPPVAPIFGSELFEFFIDGAIEIDSPIALLNQTIVLPAGKYLFHWTAVNNPGASAGAQTVFTVTGETNEKEQRAHSGFTYINTSSGFTIIEIVDETENVIVNLTISASPLVASIENFSAAVIGYRIA